VKLLSQSLFPWTPLGAPVHAGGEHAGVEPGAHVNARLQHVAGAGGLYSVLLTTAATAGIPGAEPAVAARLLGGAPVVLLLIVVVIACVHVVTVVVGAGFVTAIVVVAIVSSTAAVVSPIVAVVVVVPCVCPVITAVPVTTVILLGGTIVSVVKSAAAAISFVTSAGIGGTVPGPAVGSGAGVASVLGLPGVTLTGRVRFPGSVLGTR